MTEYRVQVYENRTEWLDQDGQVHRLDGPAIEWMNGYQEWWKNGKLHRLNGPAIECMGGHREWWKDGKLHRLDGPAFVYSSGSKLWYVNGECHRLDGPAREWENGDREWWIDGVEYSEVEFQKKVKEIKHSCEGKIVEIDGKKYKLTEV